jgi:hypothetical protein
MGLFYKLSPTPDAVFVQDQSMAKNSYRNHTTREFRALPLRLSIDPGFVHRRKIQTIIGDGGMNVIDDMINRLPDIPEWMRDVRIDHIYTRVMLEYCRINNVKTLEDALKCDEGELFCSTFELKGFEEFFNVKRGANRVKLLSKPNKIVKLQYSTDLVRSDTLRSRLHSGTRVSAIGVKSICTSKNIILDPMIVGFPWLESEDPNWSDKVMWFNNSFYENYLEDFDEFERVTERTLPEDYSIMRRIPEIGFKRALARILIDRPQSDWGGETSDHFTTHLHLGGKRVTAAFLLKGPANFTPMTLRHLGKNGDQLIRLVQEPADIFFVQHCHEITPAVRTMIRALAVQPGSPRRYCCIDGRESLRFLETFGQLDFAMAQARH